MKTRTSQATRRAAAAQQAKYQVMEILGIDELEYASIQFETAYVYLSLLLEDEHYESMLQRSRVFWSWWKNQWLLRDEQFLQAVKYSRWAVSMLGELQYNAPCGEDFTGYLSLNDPQTLASDIHPNGIVLRDSYAVMIGQIMDLRR